MSNDYIQALEKKISEKKLKVLWKVYKNIKRLKVNQLKNMSASEIVKAIEGIAVFINENDNTKKCPSKGQTR